MLGVAGSTMIGSIHSDTMLSGGTTDVEQSSTTGLGECTDEDSTVDLSNMSYEVALQHDRGVDSHESQHLAGQLKVREDMIMATMRHLDDTHTLVTGYCWRAMVTQDSSGGEFSIEDFQTLRESDGDEDQLPTSPYG
jgi:hypothetical protein